MKGYLFYYLFNILIYWFTVRSFDKFEVRTKSVILVFIHLFYVVAMGCRLLYCYVMLNNTPCVVDILKLYSIILVITATCVSFPVLVFLVNLVS